LFKQNRDLQEAKEKAEENEKLKTTFLANMAHEIRTPMNGILGFSELLKNRNLSKQKQEEFLNIIEDSGNKLLYIINNLIDISKIEAGQMKVNTVKTNINEIIDYIYYFFGPETEKYKMQLICSKGLADNQAIVDTDHDKVNAVLINLVNNAIKYSQRGTITFGYQKKMYETTSLSYGKHTLRVVTNTTGNTMFDYLVYYRNNHPAGLPSGTYTYEAKDTLVVRDRGVTMEVYNPVISN